MKYPNEQVIFNSKIRSEIKETAKKLDNLADRAMNNLEIRFPKHRDSNNKKINELVRMTDNRLYMLSSIFPFDLFPNKIIIEQKQIVLRYSQFFFTHQDYHVLISDILMPVVEVSLLFATLRIELAPGGLQQNPAPIKFLFKKEAMKAKMIIAGLLLCHKEKIDLSNMTTEEILEKVEEIGRYRTD